MRRFIVGFIMCAVSWLPLGWGFDLLGVVGHYSGFKAVFPFIFGILLIGFSILQIHGIGKDIVKAHEIQVIEPEKDENGNNDIWRN